MPGEWFCQIQDTVYGPLDSKDIKRMATSGKLRPTDTVKNSENGRWVPAKSVKGLIFSVPQEPVAGFSAEDALPTPEKKCPGCQSILQPNAILCINCGFNLRTGTKHSRAIPTSGRGRKILLSAGTGTVVLITATMVYYTIFHRGTQTPILVAPDNKAPSLNHTGANPDSGLRIEPSTKGDKPTKTGATISQQPSNDPFAKGVAKKVQLNLRFPAMFGQGILTLPEPLFKKALKRFGKFDKDTLLTLGNLGLDAFKLPRSAEERMALFMFLSQPEALWKEEIFQYPTAEQFLSRAARLPEADIEKWQTALKAIYPEDNPDRAVIVGFLIQLEGLFQVADYKTEKSMELLARLQSLSPQPIDKWMVMLDYPRKASAALSLVEHDALFEQNRFQEKLFDEAVKSLQKSDPN